MSLKFQFPVLTLVLALIAGRDGLRAGEIAAGNVTAVLGPAFFVDEAATGGGDSVVTQPAAASFNRSFAGMLTRNQGATRLAFTGFGFATSNGSATNTATTLTVAITYLGADEALGGGDDVSLASAAGNYHYSGAGEYVFAFDTPMTANLDITGVRFLIQVSPAKAGGGGSVSFKTGALAYETASGPKFSVSGFTAPQRVNLAKYQPVTTDSVNGQQLASYVTDGVTGNDNRWQSAGSGPHWARVDFPFPVEVASAQVFFGVDDGLAMTAFKLQYLAAATWTDVPGASVSGNAKVERTIIFSAPVTASAFRLYDSADGTIRVREMALYPPGSFPIGTDVTVNLASGRPALATSNTAGNFALLAVDGRVNKDSMWQTSQPGNNELTIDLRTATKIGSAHLYSGSPGVPPVSDFVMRYWNGTAWQDIPGGGVTGNISPELLIPFTGTVTTSSVKLVFSNIGTSSVRELCVFPANNSGGYALGTGVTGAPPSAARFDDFTDAIYRIDNPASGLSIGTIGGAPGLGVSPGRYQVLLNIGAGTYRLCNRATGNCLSGARLSGNSGEPLRESPYTALPDQDWILQKIGGTGFRLINQWSGLAMDTQGAALVQNGNSGAASQRWDISRTADFPKKGSAGGRFAIPFNGNWAYGWALNAGSSLPPGTIFNPMQWGNFNWDAGTPNASTWKSYPAWRTTARPIHLMGFNEPDGVDQANVAVDTAVAFWPRLLAMDLPLVSPAAANLNGGWMASFYNQADALGYRVDYTAIHNYPGPGGGSSDGLVNAAQAGYDTWGRPVWLTEFSFVNWTGSGTWTEEDNYNSLAEFLWRAESLPWLRKYSLFVFTADGISPQPAQPWSPVGPRSNAIDSDGNLTSFGRLYAAWDGDAKVETGKTYFIHNRNTRKRIANPPASQSPGAGSIRADDVSVRWTLVPAGVSGQYHIDSARDGRRLSYTDGGAVTMAAAGTAGSAVQWELKETEYGWFYLEHPATAKRLKLTYANATGAATFGMQSKTTAGDTLEWRFIVPPPPPVWTGETGNSWNTAGNWTPPAIPTAADIVSFDAVSSANLVTVLGRDFEIAGLNLVAPAGPVSIDGSETLTIGANGIDLGTAGQNLTIDVPVILGSNQSWAVASGRILSVNGGISGNAGLIVTGQGNVTLGGAGSYTGDTTINAGAVLGLAAEDVLSHGGGMGNLIVNGTLDLNGFHGSVNGLSGGGIVDNLATAAATLTVGGNDAASVFSGILRNTGGPLSLVKTGGGLLTLPGNNLHSGGTVVNGAGTVRPVGNDAFGSGSVTMNSGTIYPTTGSYTFSNALTLNGGTLRIGGGAGKSLVWSGPVTITADSAISADGSTGGVAISGGIHISSCKLSSFSGGGSAGNIISGAITGEGGNLVVTGGKLTLSGVNDYTGTTAVEAGTLALAASGVLPDTSAVILGNATLNAAGFSNSAGYLNVTGAATIQLGQGATLAFADSSALTWESGALNLAGTFVSGASLRFGTGSGGLTRAQLARITAPGIASFSLNSGGYLVAGGYGAWAAIHAPGGSPGGDADGDGVGNALEYVLGGDGETRDAIKLPKGTVVGENFVFGFYRDQASIDGVTALVIEAGSSLSGWPDKYPVPADAVSQTPGLTVLKDSPAGFDTVTLVIPMTPGTAGFVRLKVTP